MVSLDGRPMPRGIGLDRAKVGGVRNGQNLSAEKKRILKDMRMRLNMYQGPMFYFISILFFWTGKLTAITQSATTLQQIEAPQ